MAKFVYVGQGEDDNRKTSFTLKGDKVIHFRRGNETEVNESESPDHARLAQKLRGNGHFQEVKAEPSNADGVE